MSLPSEPRNWTRDDFTISSDKSLLSLSAINAAFDQDFMYWTVSYPEDVLKEIIDRSFCLGLYKAASQSSSPEQIGFARLVSDNVTFAYLTDVYVLPSYQGHGLGGWLIECMDELTSELPHLRWFMLRTSVPKSVESYQKKLGMFILDQGDVTKDSVMMGKRGGGNLV